MRLIREALERSREEARGGEDSRGPAQEIPEESLPRLPPFGGRPIPVAMENLRESRIVAGEEGQPIAESFKILRTHILQRMKAKGQMSLAVTSPQKGQGKSVIAVNLAVSMAREVDLRVLLVDLDLRRPSVHRIFGVDARRGLSDFLLHNAPLDDLFFNPGIERLCVLPAGRPTTLSSEMLLSPQARSFAAALRSQYASVVVIFDLPPLLSTDDVIAFLPNLESVLLVVEERKTRRQDVARSLELLRGSDLVGTVLNNSTLQAHSYYY